MFLSDALMVCLGIISSLILKIVLLASQRGTPIHSDIACLPLPIYSLLFQRQILSTPADSELQHQYLTPVKDTQVYEAFALCTRGTVEAERILGSLSVAPLSNTACQLLPGNKEKCPSVCLDFSHSKFGDSNVDSAWILSPRSKEHNFSRTFLFSAPTSNSQWSRIVYFPETLSLE